MSISVAAILSVILTHPSWADRDLSREEREHALEPIAEAIAETATSRAEAASLISDGMHESGNFSVAVVLHGCDGLPARACDRRSARGAFQLHASACPAAFEHAAGSVESIRAEVRCAVSLLRGYASQCREHGATPLHAAFTGMALGHCGSWRGADARVSTTRRIAAELARAEAG